MLLLDSFDGLKVDKELSALFDNVEIVKVKMSRENRHVIIFTNSNRIIEYKNRVRMEDELYRQVFANAADRLSIEEHFDLPGNFDLSRILSVYKESLYDELQHVNYMDYSILHSASIDIDDANCAINISTEDDFITRRRSDSLCQWLKNMFISRFDMQVVINITYLEKTEKEKSDTDGIVPYEIFNLQTMKSFKVSPLDYARGVDDGQSLSDVKNEDDDIVVPVNESDDNEEIAIQTVKLTENIEEKRKEKPKEEIEKKPAKQVSKATNKNYNGGNGSGGKYSGKGDWKDRKFKPKAPADPDIIYKYNCDGDVLKICDIQEEIGEAVIQGCIDFDDPKELRTGNYLLTLNVTDFTDTLPVKLFLKPAEYEILKSDLCKGKFIRVKGIVAEDKFDHDLAMSNVMGIKPIAPFTNRTKRIDECQNKRVELHCHTQMSDMDGVSSPESIVKRAVEWGHKALAITDHGIVQAFPIAMHAREALEKKIEAAKDFKIIYGLEGYLVDDEIPLIKNESGQTLDDTFVVFDLETTGLNPYKHYIIEIGAVKVKKGIIVERFSEFVNPLVSIPYEIEELTGIKDAMLKDAEVIENVLPAFLDFCKDAVLVAHNAEFDVNFIRLKAAELGLNPEFTVADTMTMARVMLDIKTFNLKHVAKELNISLENHHRAVDDAEATAGIFLRFIDMLKKKGLSTLAEVNEFGKMTPEIIHKTPSYHIILLAANDTGRINLYRLVSESHITYFHRQARIPKSLLTKYREGIIIGSACEAGDLYQALLRAASEKEIARIVNFYDYLEIQPVGNNAFMLRDRKYGMNNIEDLQEVNRRIVFLGEQYNKPVVATCDVHFLDPEDEVYRRIIMAGKGFDDADQQAPLYLHTTQEMLEEFAYLGEDKAYEVVVTNSNLIADRIEKIDPVRPDKCPPVIENSDNDLRNICFEKAHSMYGDPLPEIVYKRLEKELESIIGNGYSVMYIIAQKLVWKSVEDGYLVGSRGSVGSSFAATMSGITEVNPLPAHYYCPKCQYSDFESDIVKEYIDKSGFDMPDANCPKCGTKMVKDGHNIPFETFLGFNGDKEPDIDLNFSGEYQSKAHKYTEEIFGKGHTFRAGTIGTLAEKTAYGFVLKYYEERGIKKRRAEIERIARGCTGVRRTTGQHPGGIVVLPHGEEIYSFTPIQKPANDMTVDTITTHFEYHSIDHNLLKLDILGHDDPTMIRMLQDLTGVNIYDVPLGDEGVMSLFNSTEALGIRPEDIGGCDLGSLGVPEFGTEFAMQMLRETAPSTFSELVRIAGLSHGTDVWTNNAQDLIKDGICTLSSAICTRDDIMTYLIQAGVENGAAFKIMESVRKGKGLKDDMVEKMEAQNIPQWYFDSCRKIKYMFPKAHAVAYVMMSIRIAWFKVYKPLAYYAAFFSIRAKTFDYELMARGEANLVKNLSELQSADKLTAKDKDTIKDMKIVQEMYARGFKFEPIDIYRVKTDRFQIVDGKLMPSLCTIEGLGGNAAEMVVKEAKEGEFFSIDDFKERTHVGVKTIEKMKGLGLFGDLPQSNQLSIMDFLK